jgi:hypothetical protein
MPKKTDAKSSKRDQLHIAVERIERRIFLIRSQKIMLDSDLSELYQAPTKAFNQAVKRNMGRFPSDFMFQLCAEEMELLNRSQIVTGCCSILMTLSYGRFGTFVIGRYPEVQHSASTKGHPPLIRDRG